MRLYGRIDVSVLILRSKLVYKSTRRWFVEPVRRERKFITLVARRDETNRSIIDFHIFRAIDRVKPFQIGDDWLMGGRRLTDLSQFCEVVAQVQRWPAPVFLIHSEGWFPEK
jgi:hypothetical protein